MKKHRIEKLKINRETLRQLESRSLRQAAGISSPSHPNTCCITDTCTACSMGC